MELSQPRWSEDTAAVDAMVGSHAGVFAPVNGDTTVERIAGEATLTGPNKASFEKSVKSLRTQLGLREAAKHYLLLGFAVIRRVLLELDSRFKLNGGIFFLLPSELPDLIAGKDLSSTISARKKRRQVELSLEVPPVLFSGDHKKVAKWRREQAEILTGKKLRHETKTETTPGSGPAASESGTGPTA